jgi:hypothetical protein
MLFFTQAFIGMGAIRPDQRLLRLLIVVRLLCQQ